MEMSGHLHTPAILPLLKEHQVPMGQKARWSPESLPGCSDEEKKFPSSWTMNHTLVIQPIA